MHVYCRYSPSLCDVSGGVLRHQLSPELALVELLVLDLPCGVVGLLEETMRVHLPARPHVTHPVGLFVRLAPRRPFLRDLLLQRCFLRSFQ